MAARPGWPSTAPQLPQGFTPISNLTFWPGDAWKTSALSCGLQCHQACCHQARSTWTHQPATSLEVAHAFMYLPSIAPHGSHCEKSVNSSTPLSCAASSETH